MPVARQSREGARPQAGESTLFRLATAVAFPQKSESTLLWSELGMVGTSLHY